jgi:hypothetical protein
MSTAATAPDPTISTLVAADFDQALRVVRSMHGMDVRAVAVDNATGDGVFCIYGDLDCGSEQREEGCREFVLNGRGGGLLAGWLVIYDDTVRACEIDGLSRVVIEGHRMTWEIGLAP